MISQLKGLRRGACHSGIGRVSVRLAYRRRQTVWLKALGAFERVQHHILVLMIPNILDLSRRLRFKGLSLWFRIAN